MLTTGLVLAIACCLSDFYNDARRSIKSDDSGSFMFATGLFVFVFGCLIRCVQIVNQ